MTGTILQNNSNADDKTNTILIRLEDTVSDLIHVYVGRHDAAFKPKCITFLEITLPWVITSEKWRQLLQAYEDFTLTLEPGDSMPEGKIRALLAGAYHLQGEMLKLSGDEGIAQFENRVKINIEDAVQFVKSNSNEKIADKLQTFLYKQFPHVRDQSKLDQILEAIQKFAMELSSVDSETAEHALSKSLKSICNFYYHYISISDKLNTYSGSWAQQVSQFKKEIFDSLLEKRDLIELKSQILKFSNTLVSTIEFSETLGYGITFKVELELLANQIADDSLSSESLVALEKGIQLWPLQASDQMLAQTISLTDDQITPGGPTEIVLSSTPTQMPSLSNSTSSLQSPTSSNAIYQPRSLLDRLLNRNLPPLAIEYASPSDAKETHKRYPDLLQKAIELESELADLKQKQFALQEQNKRLNGLLKTTESVLLQSQNNEEMERGWKDLQVIQVRKEREKNAKLTKQVQSALEEIDTLKDTCKNQIKRIEHLDFSIARYEQVLAELESKHAHEVATLRKQIVTLTRQAADLNGALLLVGQSSSSQNISSEITPGFEPSPSLTLQFDALKDQNGQMAQEEKEIVDRLRQLSMNSPSAAAHPCHLGRVPKVASAATCN